MGTQFSLVSTFENTKNGWRRNNEEIDEAFWKLIFSKSPKELYPFLQRSYCNKVMKRIQLFLKSNKIINKFRRKDLAIFYTEIAHFFACVVFAIKENPYVNEQKDIFYVPPLSLKYLDVYDDDLKDYTTMTFERKKQFQKDLDIFIESFTLKLPSMTHYKDFCDIPFHAAKKGFHIPIKENEKTRSCLQFSSAVVKFYKTWKQGRDEIVNLLNFILVEKSSMVIINKKITRNMFHQHIMLSRNIIVEFMINLDEEYKHITKIWKELESTFLIQLT